MLVDYSALGEHLRGRAALVDHARPGYVPHAVCLVLFDHLGTMLLLIQKADTDGYLWRGQVAMAGGRIEPGDRSAKDAALRELREELGIEPADVEVLGSLGHVQTRNARNDLEVIVARWNRRSALHVDEREIARVLECHLSHLIQLHTHSGFRDRPASDIGNELAYSLPDATIWGVTARIVHQFLELVLDEGILAKT